MILALIFLSLAVVCYSIRELYYHGKLKWQNERKPLGFWGKDSDKRKYKTWQDERSKIHPDDLLYEIAPKTWYYKLTGLKYKEKFPLAGSLLVWTTDGPHHLQFWLFNFLSLSITFALGFQWLTLGLVWGLIHVIHFLVYRLLSK